MIPVRSSCGSLLIRVLPILSAFPVSTNRADAQARERPVPFDRAGRVNVMTPPLAARYGLTPPLWPVTGDYLDGRLYAVEDSIATYILVVRRPRDVMERFAITPQARDELAAAIESASERLTARAGGDTVPTMISEPVRGAFVLNQSLLGLILFAPYTAALTNDPALGTASYLFVAGGTFFVASTIAKRTPISRAQNHLSWHSARRGSAAATLALLSLAGDDVGEQAYYAALLAGGIAGDVIGFKIAKPMTDAEAHGTSHGSTVTALMTTGLLGTAGMFGNETSARIGAAIIIGGGAMGYPLGLRYVRRAPYVVTAGDVGTLVTSGLLGVAGALTFLVDFDDISDNLLFGSLTTGYALGVLAGDRWLVRPFDHTEGEARLLMLGTAAGSLMGLTLPVLAQSSSATVFMAATTLGGILGAIATEYMVAPRRAETRPAPREESSSRLRFTPSNAVGVVMRAPGAYPLLSYSF